MLWWFNLVENYGNRRPMKNLIIAFSIALMVCVPAKSEDVKPLTQEQIDQILEQAEKNGDLSQSDPKARMVIITPNNVDMFSDTDVFCSDAAKLGDGPTLIPLNDRGQPDADQLPEHCTLKHKLVARDNGSEERITVRSATPAQPTFSDTVDEPASGE